MIPQRRNLFAPPVSSEDPAPIAAEPAWQPDSVSPGMYAAQRAVIGAILQDNSVFEIAAEALVPADFSDDISALVYGAVADIVEGKIPGVNIADPVAVSLHHAVVGKLTLAELQAFSDAVSLTPEQVESYVSLVRNDAAERNLGQAWREAGKVLKEATDASSKAESINQLLSNSYEDRSLSITTLGAAAISALNQTAQAAKEGKPQLGISYGLPELDAITAGMHDGELIIIAARPGVGKTALALGIGIYAAAAGAQVVMASMEMKAIELSKRAISFVSDVDSQAIRIGALTEEQWEQAITGTEYIDTLPFEVIDTPGVTVAALARRCRKLKRQGKLRLLIVDYLQIMSASNSRLNREQQISEISRGLKKLAMELSIPVIALAQLNRGLENRLDRRPQLSDLRESGSLEQDADVVLFVHREEMGKKGAASSGPAEIIVGKQRAGPLGDIPVHYEGKTTKFSSREQAANQPFLRKTA